MRSACRRRSITAGYGSSPARTPRRKPWPLGYFDDARLGLEAYADAIAKDLCHQLTAAASRLLHLVHGEARRRVRREAPRRAFRVCGARTCKPFGFDFIQIDDGWQEGIDGNGPQKNFTTHRPTAPIPAA